MAGLARILKLHGRMSVTDSTGNKAEWVYDYANDKPRLKGEMSKEEEKASKLAKLNK